MFRAGLEGVAFLEHETTFNGMCGSWFRDNVTNEMLGCTPTYDEHAKCTEIHFAFVDSVAQNEKQNGICGISINKLSR